MKERRTGLISLGLLLVAAALLLSAYNLWDGNRAAESVQVILGQVEQKMIREDDGEDEISSDQEEISVDGVYYIGILEIPGLNLSLPVAGEWSYPNLKNSPCRYTGSVSENNLIVAGHNYNSHFGALKNLETGDAVIFTDMDGNAYVYEVSEVTVLDGTAVKEMETGEWDLTLFTCTIGGRARVTVRCERVS